MVFFTVALQVGMGRLHLRIRAFIVPSLKICRNDEQARQARDLRIKYR